LSERIPPEQSSVSKNLRPNERGLESLSEEERKAWHLLVPAHKISAIQPESFTGYDQQAIKRDLEAVEKKEQIFSREGSGEQARTQRRAELLEAMLNEQISAKATKWLGNDSESIVASRYDDIFNGVDLILEMVREEGFKHLALNIDVTSSPSHLYEKLSGIKEKIRSGTLSRVKYFRSKGTQPKFMGELSNLPKVVIGVDAKTIRELSMLRIDYHTARKGSKLEENGAEIRKSLAKKAGEALRKMAKHRIQILIIKEIELQLHAFSEFARKHNQEEAASAYESALETIGQIKASKQSPNNPDLKIILSQEDAEKNDNDEVYQALALALKDL